MAFGEKSQGSRSRILCFELYKMLGVGKSTDKKISGS